MAYRLLLPPSLAPPESRFPLAVTDASGCRSISKKAHVELRVHCSEDSCVSGITEYLSVSPLKNGSMGNLLGCSAAGERLVTAARDGDVIEAQKLMELNPGLARYSTFAGFSTPMHAAAAGGHTEIIIILLENGADVNSRTAYGQTPLMEACSGGRWEVVQTLLLFKCNVSKVEFLSGRTALHFAAAGGHTRCIRLLAADFSHSSSLHAEAGASKNLGEGNLHNSPLMNLCNDSNALTRFIDKAAYGGITPLHLAALSGHSDCVHLLLDLGASVAATTLSYASPAMAIGAGSTPLHYAASGGSLKSCQILLARGASRSIMNCNGWFPVDVARIWGSHWLIPLLSPHSTDLVPAFPPSNYLPLPLKNILQIARVYGLHSSTPLCVNDACVVCLERTCTVAAEGCGHELCTRCALSLCSTSSISSEISAPPGSIPCPLCRNGIVSFVRLPTTPKNAIKPSQETILCKTCASHHHGQNPFSAACGSELCKNKFAVAPQELITSSWHLHMTCQNQRCASSQ